MSQGADVSSWLFSVSLSCPLGSKPHPGGVSSSTASSPQFRISQQTVWHCLTVLSSSWGYVIEEESKLIQFKSRSRNRFYKLVSQFCCRAQGPWIDLGSEIKPWNHSHCWELHRWGAARLQSPDQSQNWKQTATQSLKEQNIKYFSSKRHLQTLNVLNLVLRSQLHLQMKSSLF